MKKIGYRYGISTTIDYTEPIEDIVRMAAAAGFEFLSLGADHKQSHLWDINRFNGILDLAGELEIEIDSLHVPFGGDFDLAARDRARRKLAVSNTLKYIERSLTYGIDTVIIHPHHYFEGSKESALSESEKSLKEIVLQAPDQMNLAVENLPDERGSWVCSRLLDRFGPDEIGWCYDSSHENISGRPFHLLEKYIDRLTVTHLSDNHGQNDDHLVPGEGEIDWPEMSEIISKNDKMQKLLFEIGTGAKLEKPIEAVIAQAHERILGFFG